jgi:Family of unknown function (DUF6496)
MAKKRKYSRSAGKDVKNEMHRYKRGKAKSGPGGKGGKVKSRRQAIAIALKEAGASKYEDRRALQRLGGKRGNANSGSAAPRPVTLAS